MALLEVNGKTPLLAPDSSWNLCHQPQLLISIEFLRFFPCSCIVLEIGKDSREVFVFVFVKSPSLSTIVSGVRQVFMPWPSIQFYFSSEMADLFQLTSGLCKYCQLFLQAFGYHREFKIQLQHNCNQLHLSRHHCPGPSRFRVQSIFPPEPRVLQHDILKS